MDRGKALNRLTVEGQAQGFGVDGHAQAMNEEGRLSRGPHAHRQQCVDYLVLAPTLRPSKSASSRASIPWPLRKEAGEESLAALLPA